jgi:hypothetical protein
MKEEELVYSIKKKREGAFYLDGELHTKYHVTLLHVVDGAGLEVGETCCLLEKGLEALQEARLCIDLRLGSNVWLEINLLLLFENGDVAK